MSNKTAIHLEGYIENDEDGIILRDKDKEYIGQLVSIIGNRVGKNVKSSRQGEPNKDMGGESFLLEDCRLLLFYSPHAMSYEDSKKNNLTLSLGGELDGYGENYGYSEFTIMGMSQDLVIGGHDVQEELASHDGEYVHILIEYSI